LPPMITFSPSRKAGESNGTQIFEEGIGRRRPRNEETQGRHAEERPLGQEGQEPQAGYRDRAVGGEGQGQEGAEKGIEEGIEEAEDVEEKDREEVEAVGGRAPSLRAQRSNPESRRRSGLLRRFAPRNDGSQ
jgi:hypothetical protein